MFSKKEFAIISNFRLISGTNFILSWVEHKKSFITSKAFLKYTSLLTTTRIALWEESTSHASWRELPQNVWAHHAPALSDLPHSRFPIYAFLLKCELVICLNPEKKMQYFFSMVVFKISEIILRLSPFAISYAFLSKYELVICLNSEKCSLSFQWLCLKSLK